MTAQPIEYEPASLLVARRLRGLLAEHRISATAVAGAIGMLQPAMSRRVNGHTAFALDELADIAVVLDVSLAWLVSGGNEEAPRRVVLDEGRLEAVRHVGLEPTTRCLAVIADQELGEDLVSEPLGPPPAPTAVSWLPAFSTRPDSTPVRDNAEGSWASITTLAGQRERLTRQQTRRALTGQVG